MLNYFLFRMKLDTSKDFTTKFEHYPTQVKHKLLEIRQLVHQAAEELDIKILEETLKWGEPSFIAPKGSTLRIDWKEKNKDLIGVYFKCTSKLIPTIREVYKDSFVYENNRAILFNLNDQIPSRELKNCIKLALSYHSRKHKELLGIEEFL